MSINANNVVASFYASFGYGAPVQNQKSSFCLHLIFQLYSSGWKQQLPDMSCRVYKSLQKKHWCRRWGCRVCKRTPKTIDLLKIWAKSLKIQTKSLNIWAKTSKIWAKMTSNVVWLQKWAPTFAEKQVKTISLEVTPKKRSEKLHDNILGTFGQKFFATPKISLLLHLWEESLPQ